MPLGCRGGQCYVWCLPLTGGACGVLGIPVIFPLPPVSVLGAPPTPAHPPITFPATPYFGSGVCVLHCQQRLNTWLYYHNVPQVVCVLLLDIIIYNLLSFYLSYWNVILRLMIVTSECYESMSPFSACFLLILQKSYESWTEYFVSECALINIDNAVEKKSCESIFMKLFKARRVRICI